MISSLERTVAKLVAPIKNRVMLMIARSVVQLVDDTTMMQIVQLGVQADVVRNNVERFEDYGKVSYPVPSNNTEALLVHVQGNTAHPIAVAIQDRTKRPKGKLAIGDTALYTAADGILVWLKANQMVELGPTPTDFVALATPTKSVIMQLRTDVNALVTSVNALVTAHNTHTHTGTSVSGGAVTTIATTTLATNAAAPATVGEVKAAKVKAI